MTSRIKAAIDLLPRDLKPSRALDLSAGEGESSRLLAGRGWRVVSTEYHPSQPGWVAANLTADFPFRAEQFDLVVMLEVIEHLENIYHALCEISRVLKPGGIALVSTPNRLNMTSRIHYLFSGFYKGRRAPLPYRYTVDDGRNWHILGLNDLHWMAHGAGLEIDALGRGRRKLKTVIWASVFYLPVRLFSWMLYGANAADPEQKRINRQLFKLMTGASLLMDENLIMRMRKRGAPNRRRTG